MTKKSGLADSPFFMEQNSPPASPPEEPAGGHEPQEDEHPAVQDVPPVPPVPPVEEVREERDVEEVRPVRGQRRQIKHHPFSIYEDQLEALRTMKVEAMYKGIERSMASMVREALDRFIEENR